MGKDLTLNNNLSFADKIYGGAFVCSAHGEHQFLYVNDNLVKLFECDDPDDFYSFVGGSVIGMINETQFPVVKKEIRLQLDTEHTDSGYVFYNIRTKKDHIRRVVNHWTIVDDPDKGKLVYGIVFPHMLENSGTDFDPITGLCSKRRFRMQIAGEMMKTDRDRSVDHAIVYLNLVNFKRLNIDRGVAEGDACLKVMADTLIEVFADAVISRISDDRFAVFTKYKNIHEKTEEAQRRFCERYGNQFNLIGKFGIIRFSLDSNLGVEEALSHAKVACDHIKYSGSTDVIEYSESLEKMIKTQEYVVGKIDEAIEKGWIKVYFQPVIRSLTQTLCGMESLTRWDDPEIGFLPPDEFISTLENERCIHKLDAYVVENVCRIIRERVDEGKSMVPVSVNFSRIDFQMCDMLQVVESAVEKYDIPRDYIHIEITESMIASDEELMTKVIDSFRNAGYEIWMDDFGSGYSSLTVLKDYHFDMLKLDMRFLTPFTDKSKSIIQAVVGMAKGIGIKTVAEGVETEEQLEFLKEIGCGMIQGYYYGKPEPIELLFRHLKEKEIDTEFRKDRYFYDEASLNVRVTDEPLDIVEDDGTNFKTLYMNRSFRKQIMMQDISLDEIDHILYRTGSPLIKKYREFADQVERSGVSETFYYTAGDSFLRLTLKMLVESEGHYLIKGSIYNMTQDRNLIESARLDQKLRGLNMLFENVLLVNLKKNTVVPLLGGFQYIHVGESSTNDLQEGIKKIAEKAVFPTEQKKCLEFLKSADLYDRVMAGGKGYIEKVFRFKDPDGNYRRKEVYIMLLPGSQGNEYLYCMKPFTYIVSETGTASTEYSERDTALMYADIWRNLMWNSSIKFYWKDKDRRFLGASRSFLDYFGINTLGDLIGKTEEEMRWHVDNEPYADDELKVLNKGAQVIDAPGKCIVKGKVHEIASSKLPMYSGNEIVGLIGCFEDTEDRTRRIKYMDKAVRTDRVTGLMNAHAFVDAMIDMAARYNDNNEEYGIILLNNRKHDRILETYGKEFGDRVLKVVADKLLYVAGDTCAISRQKGSVFALISAVDSRDEFLALGEKIKEAVNGINEVDGNSVTIRIKLTVKIRSESRVADEALYETAYKEVVK